ncbi:hypothetical protein BN871_DE_00130 [Paenibacillus sp. P22]|nr:hypothetical protein BN871_DE_00130 [Paenibacillus sp. P22]
MVEKVYILSKIKKSLSILTMGRLVAVLYRFEEFDDRQKTFVEVFQVEMLVRSMEVLVVQSKAHQYDRGLENAGEGFHDRDGAAVLGEEGTGPVHGPISVRSRLQNRMGRIDVEGEGAFAALELKASSWLDMRVQVLFDPVHRQLRILLAYKTASNFRMGHLGDDGFAALALETAVHAVEFQRRTGADAFHERIAFFAVQSVQSESFANLVLIQALLGEFFPHESGELRNAFVEAFYGDFAFLVMQGVQQRDERMQGIRHRAAVGAGVKVRVGRRYGPSRPRRPVQMAGRPRSSREVSDTRTASHASLFLWVSRNGGRLMLPISSSPSMQSLTLTGSVPSCLRIASIALIWMNVWPLSSVVPRPYSLSPRISGSNGGLVHRFSGSTG